MLIGMSRYPLHAVTHFPVLVDWNGPPAEADGWITVFPRNKLFGFHAVKRVYAQRVKTKDGERSCLVVGRIKYLFSEIFTGEEAKQFLGASLLRHAYKREDERALEMGLDDTRRWIPMMGKTPAARFGRPNDPRWAERVGGAYSSLMCNFLQNARLIAWRPPKEGTLQSGLHCPDLKTAAFVLMALDGIRVCPKCHRPFIPKTDRECYCRPSHGIAYRTARSRRKRKGTAHA
jgi:hypothetical protein